MMKVRLAKAVLTFLIYGMVGGLMKKINTLQTTSNWIFKNQLAYNLATCLIYGVAAGLTIRIWAGVDII